MAYFAGGTGLAQGVSAGAQINANAISERNASLRAATDIAGLDQQLKLKNREVIMKDFQSMIEDVKAAAQAGGAPAARRVADQLTNPLNLTGMAARMKSVGMNETVDTLSKKLYYTADFTPDPSLVGAGEGTKAASKNVSQSNALTQAGVPSTQAQETAGIKQPGDIRGETFIRKLPAGGFESMSVSSDDTEKKRALISGGWMQTAPTQITGGVGDLAAKSEATATGGLTAKAVQEAGKLTGSALTASDLLSRLKTLGPGVTGIFGAAGEIAGGTIGQFNKFLGDMVTQGLTGATPQELTEFRREARAVLADMIAPVTGEESGRVTESERQLANDANRILSLNASGPQIVAALESGIKTSILSRERMLYQAGKPPSFNLDSQEGILNAGQTLNQTYGLNERQAGDLVRRMMKHYQEMRSLPIGRPTSESQP